MKKRKSKGGKAPAYWSISYLLRGEMLGREYVRSLRLLAPSKAKARRFAEKVGSTYFPEGYTLKEEWKVPLDGEVVQLGGEMLPIPPKKG